MKQHYDRWILLIVILLMLIGLMAVYSSTSVISPEMVEKYRKKGISISQFYFLKKQLFTLALGIIAMFIAYKIPLQYLKKMVIPLLILSLIALLLVFTPMGVEGGGARRWVRIWPSTFQPSELVKLSMVIFLAWYMSLTSYKKDKFLSFAVPIGIMGMFQGIFLMQPDFGAAASLGILTVSMLFLSGVRLRYLFSLGIIALPIIAKLILEPYRWKRVVAFLDPWKDAQGSGFQLVQSFIALGSGGLRGVGLGEGKQKLLFLPEVHTDFIFSLIGEESGFIGAAFVVSLFFILFIKGILIARKTTDAFHYYLAFGISMMIAIQAVMNFAVVTGMVPTKGLPLPFISYGGSSLFVSMAAIGLLMNLSKDSKELRASCKLKKNDKDSSLITHHSSLPLRWQRGHGYKRYSKMKRA